MITPALEGLALVFAGCGALALLQALDGLFTEWWDARKNA